MNIEELRALCLSFPSVTEDVKWGADLCFCVGEKIFCVTGLEGAFSASLKVPADQFDELAAQDGIIPAPYLARYKWVLVTDADALSKAQWEQFTRQSYDLVLAKLPKKLRTAINGSS
jgi:predicted DNA-binding protein (MmcQ/YjbR family)